MDQRCPHCGEPLRQLGTNRDAGDGKVWVGENLYGCRECGYGHNRFTVVNERLEPALPAPEWVN